MIGYFESPTFLKSMSIPKTASRWHWQRAGQADGQRSVDRPEGEANGRATVMWKKHTWKNQNDGLWRDEILHPRSLAH